MKKLIAIALTAMFVMGGCSPKAADNQPADKLTQIKNAKELVMYTNAAFPPYEFMDNNKIVGVDVEIGEAIAAKIGVPLKIMNAEFDGIVASIASGKGDVAISGITINDDRKAMVDFSTPYVDSVQYVVLKDTDTAAVVEDFAGKALGTQLGTTGAMLIEDEVKDGVLKGTNAELKTYNSGPAAMQDLLAGRIQGVVIDELVAVAIAAESNGYKAVPLKYKSGDPVTEQFGVAIKKGDQKFLDLINEVVGGMVKDGKIDAAVKTYSN